MGGDHPSQECKAPSTPGSKKLRSLPLGLYLSGGIVALGCLLGLIAPLIPYDPASAVDYQRQLAGPSWDHLLGCDGQGRDIALRIVKGTEAFFWPGILAMTIAVIGGAACGACAGYMRGWVGQAVRGLMQLLDTLPRLVFIVLLCTILDPGMYLIATTAGVLFIPTIAAICRRKVETLASEDYILAHIAHGFHPAWILGYHILWLQCRPLLIRQACTVFSYVLFVETALSYLGDYGVQEPWPSWGNMVAQTREGVGFWPWFVPAVMIVVSIAALLAFGNAIARREEALR